MITNIRGMDPSYTMAYDHPIHIMNRKSMYDTNHQMIGTPTKNRGMNLSIENPGPRVSVPTPWSRYVAVKLVALFLGQKWKGLVQRKKKTNITDDMYIYIYISVCALLIVGT